MIWCIYFAAVATKRRCENKTLKHKEHESETQDAAFQSLSAERRNLISSLQHLTQEHMDFYHIKQMGVILTKKKGILVEKNLEPCLICSHIPTIESKQEEEVDVIYRSLEAN
ncbi:hypothetical protein ILYODFUR_038485 [Ilyodon furcidens]|uniref:Uncharacterized protein n=1 Tax=Ilyodon furcidens TaxID=33524 RepID=A0ABV0UYP7_9TELE